MSPGQTSPGQTSPGQTSPGWMSPARLERLWHQARVLVPWAALALLPFGRASEGAMVVMAVGGLVLLLRRGLGWLREPAPALLLGVFACMWLPIAISIPDAARPDTATRIALVHLRFALVGLFVIEALGTREAFERFLRLCAWLLAVWILDTAVQGVFGQDLLGQPGRGKRLTGPFGDNRKYGLVLAILTPLLIEHARRHWSWAATLAAGLAAFTTVLFAGTRSGWVVYVLLAGFYAVLAWSTTGRLPWRATAVTLVLGVGVAALGATASNALWRRLFGFRHLLSSDDALNAFSHRIWIWRGTWNAFLDNPITGVGARGIRYVFVDYAAPGDPFVARDPPLTPSHPHHLLLEVGSETGLVGVVGLLLAVTLMVRACLRAGPARALLVPAGFALGAAVWPLNTHLAIYSAYWSVVIWWLVAVYCASYRCALETPPTRS